TLKRFTFRAFVGSTCPLPSTRRQLTKELTVDAFGCYGPTMDRMTALIIRLQRLGYRTKTFGDEIVLELGAHSRVRGSSEQIERLMPRLTLKAPERDLRKAKTRPK